MLIDKPPADTPAAWKVKRYLVDRTRNLFWEWIAANDGHFTSSTLLGPQVWPASGQPPEWIDPRDITVITARHGRYLTRF